MTCSHAENILALGHVTQGSVAVARLQSHRYAIVGRNGEIFLVTGEISSTTPSTMGSWEHLLYPRKLNHRRPSGSKARSAVRRSVGANLIADTTPVRGVAIHKTSNWHIVHCHQTSFLTAPVAKRLLKTSPSSHGSHAKIRYRTATSPATSYLAVTIAASTGAIPAHASPASRPSRLPVDVAGPPRSPSATKATYSPRNASEFAAPSSAAEDTSAVSIAARGRRRPRSGGGRSATRTVISKLSTYAYSRVAAHLSVESTPANSYAIRAPVHRVWRPSSTRSAAHVARLYSSRRSPVALDPPSAGLTAQSPGLAVIRSYLTNATPTIHPAPSARSWLRSYASVARRR